MRGRGEPTKVDVYILHDGRLSSHAATNGVMKSLGIEAEALECVGSFLRFDRHGHAFSFLTEMQTVGTSSIELHDYLGDRLHRELGVKPEMRTTQLLRVYESIRQRRRAPAAPSAGTSPGEPDAPTAPGPVELPLPSKPSIAVLGGEVLCGRTRTVGAPSPLAMPAEWRAVTDRGCD
jgi:hypothetical protein